MRNFVIASIVLFAMAGTACNKEPKPSKEGKAPNKAGADGEAKSPLKELAVDLGGGVKMELVLIPAGEFLMGSPDSDENANPAEKPQHQVRITKPFYLGKYLVTYAPQPDKHRPAFAGATLRRLPQAHTVYAGRWASDSIDT